MELILKNLLDNYIEILSVNLTFIGIILAIFFTLIVLPVQNILGRYSQDLVNKITNNWFFRFSYSILAVIFLYDLLLLVFPRYFGLILATIILAVFSLIILIILINRIFILFDIRNQLNEITKNIRKKIPKNLKINEELEFKNTKDESSGILNPVKRFKVPEKFVFWLQDNSEIIFDVIQKAVQENRFEIVESGLINIQSISKDYISARKNYLDENDKYSFFIIERLKDTRNLISNFSHPKIMNSIVNTCGVIAINWLNIKPIRALFDENYIPLGYVRFLKEIILSKEIIKETSYAPTNACDKLLLIGIKALDYGFPKTTDVVSKEIGEISRFLTTKLHYFYSDYVAGKANSCIGALAKYTLINMDKIKVDVEFVLKSTLEEINKSIKSYFEDDYYYIMRSNIKPFIGLVADDGIAPIFVNSLTKYKKTKDLSYILEALDVFLSDINQNVMLGMNKKRYLDIQDLLNHIYTLSIVLAFIAKEDDNPEIKKKILNLFDKEILCILTNPIYMSLKTVDISSIPFHHFLNIFSSTLGTVFILNKNKDFNSIINNWVKKIIEILRVKDNATALENIKEYPDHKNKIFINNLYRHIRLIGSWIFKWMNDSSLLFEIRKTLREKEAIEIDSHIRLIEKYIEYPKSAIGNNWFLEMPSGNLINLDFINKCSNELFNEDNLSKFEEFLDKD